MLQERTIQATKLDGFGAWLRACKLGDDEGCSLLGDYVDRWGIEHPRVVEAEDELLDACGKGEPKACVGAGHLLVRHEPRSEAYGRALTLFVGACDAGLPQGCIAGAEQRRIGTTRDLELPDQRSLWEKACSLESPEGCAGFGAVLARDRDEWGAAFTAWSKACATGESSACTDLGELVTRKHEVPWPSELASREYYSQGCEFGDPEGCFGLAQLDMPKKEDPSEPVYVLLERSCEGDFGTGCAELGRIHLARKTSFDDELAADHLEAACDNGHFDSCKALGEMYQKGKGVEKDRLRARELAQRYSVNARRRHVRVGAHLGFPYVAGPEAELVAPIPVGPAIAITGSYSYLPQLGGALVQLKGESYPDNPPDLQYLDAGVRLYGNNKARGLYGMVGWHQLQASGGDVQQPLIRNGFSARFGMHLENRFLYSRVEMGLGQYGVVYMRDFDEDETGSFPLIQATLGLSFGFSVL
jgi:TPR repeat protein